MGDVTIYTQAACEVANGVESGQLVSSTVLCGFVVGLVCFGPVLLLRPLNRGWVAWRSNFDM